MNALTILVADDDENIRALLEHLLVTAGHAVTAVGNAGEACVVMAKQSFDLVITDVLMPDGDGIDLITQLKRVQPRARILAMSGGGRYLEGGDYLKLAKGIGAHAAVMKPFDSQQFQAAMALALGRS